MKAKHVLNLLNRLKPAFLMAGLLLAMWLPQQTYATHIVGSDIAYKCTSTPGVFEITMVVYRDCGEGESNAQICNGPDCNAACTIQLNILGADPTCINSNFGSVTLSLVSIRDVNIELECPNAKNKCTNKNCVVPGSYSPSIERYEFKGFANVGPTSPIPANCCNVRFAYSNCCRNSTIATGAADAGFYVDATINRCLSVNPCNSSPELTNDPYAITCGGIPFVFNNGAQDPDYDSLSYSFAPSLTAFNTPVPYTPPFNFDRPMPWTGPVGGNFPQGIRCDPTNGDIMFTPGNTGSGDFIGVMVVEIKQWKIINGVPQVIGVTRRDIQVVVLDPTKCPSNNPPRLVTNPPLGTNPNSPRFNWEICAGEQLCFTVTAKDTDFLPPTISDTTFLSWNNALGPLGATFLPTYDPNTRRLPPPIGRGPREDEYRFCWTPDDNRASNTPYYFTISAKDKRCPNPARVTRAFSVRVYGRSELQINKQDNKCGRWRLSYSNLKPSFSPISILWEVSTVPGDFSLTQNVRTFSLLNQSFDMTFTQGGRYLVSLKARTRGPNNGFCERVFYDTIVVDTAVQPQVRDTFNCRGSSVRLTAQGRYGQGPLYTYRWFNSIRDTALPPLNGTQISNPSLTVAPSATRYYTIQVRDLNQCRGYDSVRVTVRNLPVSSLIDSMRICFGDTFEFDAGNNGGGIPVKYLWSTNASDTLRTLKLRDSGTYAVLITDTFKCAFSDTTRLFVNSRIIPRAGMDTLICFGDTATLRGSGGHYYQWRELTTGATIQPKSTNPVVRPRPTNTTALSRYEVRVYQSYPDTTNKYLECSVTDTVAVTVRALPVMDALTIHRCKQDVEFQLPPATSNRPVPQGGQPGGSTVWLYPRAPGAIRLNTNGTYSVRMDSLKEVLPQDTILAMTNWVPYVYTAPTSFGSCSKLDSARVIVYGTPNTRAGSQLFRCENAGEYQITINQRYAPTGGSTAEGEEWIGPGITKRLVAGSQRWFFNPSAPGVLKLPANNNMTYKYTHTYNAATINQLQCSKSASVLFSITDPPDINAVNDLLLCNNEPNLNLTARTNSTITPQTGGSYWLAATPSANGTIVIGNGQTFNASAVNIPVGQSSTTFKVYYRDTSSGCPVADSINVRVTRVPSLRVVYDQTGDSLNVCQNSKEVYFRVWASNPTGTQFEPTLAATNLTGSSSSFALNTGSTNTSKVVFNSAGATVGSHKIRINYVDQSTTANCSNVDSNIINVLEPPTISVLTPNPICEYDAQATVTLANAPNAGYRHTWSTTGTGVFSAGPDAISQSYAPSVADKQSGLVVVTASTERKTVLEVGTNGDQCPIATQSVNLLIDKAPFAGILSQNPEGCVPLTSNYGAVSTGVANATFNWEWENEPTLTSSDSSITRTIEEYNARNNGQHRTRLTVTVTKNVACSAVSSWAPMITHAIPNASFYPDPPFTTVARPFFNFINTSTTPDNSGMTYLWNLGKGPDILDLRDRFATDENPRNIEYAPDTAWQPVMLTVTTEHGCVDSVPGQVRIEPDITVFIPSAFRPNGADDQVNSMVPCEDPSDLDCNSKFMVVANGHLTIEIFIYNRWGQLVYSSDNVTKGWNGRVQNTGDLCPQEVYVYQVNATSFNGKKYKYSGSVTLLR